MSAQAGEYRPPRLADGQVDLQGVWSHKNITPLERPADVSSFIITREQAAQLQARILAKSEDLSRQAEPSVYFWDRGIEPIRGEYRSSIITDPTDGKIPANDHFKALAKVTGAAALTAFDGPEARPGSERCLAAISAAPPVTVVPAADLRQFVQTPNAIVISSEELHEARVIRTTSSATSSPSRIRTTTPSLGRARHVSALRRADARICLPRGQLLAGVCADGWARDGCRAGPCCRSEAMK